jgi:hypothetical protein
MSKTNGTAPRTRSEPKNPAWTQVELKVLKSILQQDPPIVELPVSALNVDPGYQNRPREKMILKIATFFSNALLGVLIVSQRPDGKYYTIDGETRRLAILARHEEHRIVRCWLFHCDGSQQEALLFAFFNSARSRTPVNLITKLQAYHIAGTDKGFGKLVEECGFTLSRGKRQLKGAFYVVLAWDLDGDGGSLRKALFALKDAWRDSYPIDGIIVLAVAKLFNSQTKSIDEQVRRVLRKTNPAALMDAVAKSYFKAGGASPRIHPGDKPDIIKKVLAGWINKNPGKTGKIDLRRLADTDNDAVHMGA